MKPSIKKSYFGRLNSSLKEVKSGKDSSTEIFSYCINNNNGDGQEMEVEILNYGGIVKKISFPSRDGISQNCVLGFDYLDDYLNDNFYLGAVVGRYSNRIANGKFSLNGKSYSLAQNNHRHHLHGGIKGFNKKIWDVSEEIEDGGDAASLELIYISPDGEEGYPGRVWTKVTYRLTKENTLEIHFQVESDQSTILNLTQHSYFNLSGYPQQNILDHQLMIDANEFLSVNSEMIPTGEFESIKNTPFDFSITKKIGDALKDGLENKNQQLQFARGFDHCYVFDNQSTHLIKPKKVAELYHQQSGRKMEVSTTMPGVQLYTANHLGSPSPFVKYGGVCLETQYFPNSPNQPNFPSTTLHSGEVYRASTHFKFSHNI